MTDWQQLAAILAVLGSVLVVGKFLIKHVVRVWKKVIISMFGIGELKTDIEAMSEQLTFVVSELKPNGGASIHDSLNRIELRQVLQEQRQKAILSDMSIGVFETDAAGEFTWVNRKYLRMTGRAPDEIKGSGWINTVANRDRERVEREWESAIAEEREFESEFLLITPDDTRLEVSARTYKMTNDEKEPIGFLGMLTPLE